MESFHADRLRAFLAVAREGGFTRGARALGRTQSSVSQAVALLEDELGERLFVRRARSVHLTDAGDVLLVHAERAFAELRRARSELAALREVASGSLVLGSTDTLATYLLPEVFAAFRSRYPNIELRLVNRPSPDLAAQVAERAVDLAVMTLPLPAPTHAVTVESVAAHRDVVICPPDHALARRRRVELAALAGHSLLLLDRSTGTRAVLDREFAARGIAPHVVMEMSSVEVLKRLVELGFGASIVPAMAAGRELAAGSLCAIDVRELGSREVAIATSTAGPLSHAARAFIDLARVHLARIGHARQVTRLGRPRN